MTEKDHKKAILTKKPYDNCTIYGPDGLFLCRCNENKAKWYLQRNLAKIRSENPLEIILTFIPKGKGNYGDAFYSGTRENKCVVCGAEERLSRHHIVPQCYRRHFPEKVKNHSSHDVVLLCRKCHHSYERIADDLKNVLAKEYNAPLHNKVDTKIRRRRRIAGLAYTLLNFHSIPKDKQDKMLEPIREYLKRQDISDGDLKRLSSMKKEAFSTYTHGRITVSKITDIEGFVIRWRQHFYDIMKPKFLPKNWDINRSVYQR